MTTAITFPPGRLVMGSLTTPQTKKKNGDLMVNKDGTARVNYFFASAIPKNGTTDFKQTPWGQLMEAEGKAGSPTAYLSKKFAWKVLDGDCTDVEENGKSNVDIEGFAGCWVVKFSSGFAPKVFNADGSASLDASLVKPGYWIEVLGEVKPNGSTESPGVYVNHSMIAFAAPDKEISLDFIVDATAAGFGKTALPAGVSRTPQPALVAPTPTPPAAAAPKPPVPTAPHPGILAGPPAPVMLPAAQGATYEQCIAAGWTHEALIANGLMQA